MRRQGRGAKPSPVEPGKPPTPRHVAMSWARRLKRVFGIEIDTCQRCGGNLRILAHLERTAPEQYQRERPRGARARPGQSSLLRTRRRGSRPAGGATGTGVVQTGGWRGPMARHSAAGQAVRWRLAAAGRARTGGSKARDRPVRADPEVHDANRLGKGRQFERTIRDRIGAATCEARQSVRSFGRGARSARLLACARCPGSRLRAPVRVTAPDSRSATRRRSGRTK